MTESKTLVKAGKAFGTKQGVGEPGRQLQVLGASGQRLLGHADDAGIISDFSFVLPLPLVQVVVLAAELPDFVVEQKLVVVAEVGSTGIVTGNRGKQVFTQRHEAITRSVSSPRE